MLSSKSGLAWTGTSWQRDSDHFVPGVTIWELALTDLAVERAENFTSDMKCVIGRMLSKIYTVSFSGSANLSSA